MAIGSTVYSQTSFKKIKWWVLSCHRSLIAWSSLVNLELFLYQRISVFPHYGLSFLTQACSSRPMFSTFVKILGAKIWIFVLTTHSSVNFIWFALLIKKKFDNRPLLKPETLFLICHHSELPQNKYFCKIKIIFAIHQFKTMQSLYLWKKL